MTIPEACRLVLEAGSMGNGGEIYICLLYTSSLLLRSINRKAWNSSNHILTISVLIPKTKAKEHRVVVRQIGNLLGNLRAGGRVTPFHAAAALFVHPVQVGAAAVSYTHLDVYKRQFQNSADSDQTTSLRVWKSK